MSLPEQGIGSDGLGVKLFSGSSCELLEQKLMDWFGSSRNFKIRDVIYQQSLSGEQECHSCMVLYTLGPPSD